MSRPPSKNRIPSPTIPNNEALQRAITTRVLYSKQQKHSDDKKQKKSLPERRTSKFLSGTSIPNSTIRSSLDETVDIQEEEQVESLDIAKVSDDSLSRQIDEIIRNSEERGLERMRKKIHSISKDMESTEERLERRRSSALKNIGIPLPQGNRRRSTVDSIKKAIDKHPDHVTKLVNADSIEKKNVGQHFKAVEADPLVKHIRNSQKYMKAKTVEKQDLETQTSFILEKLLLQMQPK